MRQFIAIFLVLTANIVYAYAPNTEILTIEQLLAQIKNDGDLPSQLPEGWKIVAEKTYFSDHVHGYIVDATGTPVIRYIGKTAIYDQYLNAYKISPDESAKLKTKLEAEKKEKIAAAALENLMGENVYNRFAVQLSNFLYGSGCERGYASYLSYQVYPVKSWYQSAGEKVNEFLQQHNDTVVAQHLVQFREMFIDNSNSYEFNRIVGLCARADVAVAATIGGVPQPGLYATWKAQKNAHRQNGEL